MAMRLISFAYGVFCVLSIYVVANPFQVPSGLSWYEFEDVVVTFLSTFSLVVLLLGDKHKYAVLAACSGTFVAILAAEGAWVLTAAIRYGQDPVIVLLGMVLVLGITAIPASMCIAAFKQLRQSA